MSKPTRHHALRYQTGRETAAVIDAQHPESGPPESGPPEADEIMQPQGKTLMDVFPQEEAASAPDYSTPACLTPDCSAIVANLDRQTVAVWPEGAPLVFDWPWSGEIDPQPGDVVGWNWQRGEIAVVTAVPPPSQPWPYTLTVEVRPMPPEWRQVKIFDLNSGQRMEIEWYTRWNRAYVQFAKDAKGALLGDESADQQNREVKRTTGNGWLAVIQETA